MNHRGDLYPTGKSQLLHGVKGRPGRACDRRRRQPKITHPNAAGNYEHDGDHPTIREGEIPGRERSAGPRAKAPAKAATQNGTTGPGRIPLP